MLSFVTLDARSLVLVISEHRSQVEHCASKLNTIEHVIVCKAVTQCYISRWAVT